MSKSSMAIMFASSQKQTLTMDEIIGTMGKSLTVRLMPGHVNKDGKFTFLVDEYTKDLQISVFTVKCIEAGWMFYGQVDYDYNDWATDARNGKVEPMETDLSVLMQGTYVSLFYDPCLRLGCLLTYDLDRDGGPVTLQRPMMFKGVDADANSKAVMPHDVEFYDPHPAPSASDADVPTIKVQPSGKATRGAFSTQDAYAQDDE